MAPHPKTGTILRVDLTAGQLSKEPLSEDLRRLYAGGRGINVRLLFDELAPNVDPLSPDNVLIFGTGALSGTSAPCPARFNITAKSPLTGILGDSNAGGHFGPALRKSGIDHIIIKGKADKPSYLWIDNGAAEIRAADHLWGKNTRETEALIREELGDRHVRIAAIGQAGENLIRFANVVHQERSASRTGMGAVMGSKNLKAVAVRGSGKVPVANPDKFKQRARALTKAIAKTNEYDHFAKGSAAAGVYVTDKRGFFAVKNYAMAGGFEGIEKFEPQQIVDKYYTGRVSCNRCPIACGTRFELRDGPYAGEYGVKIEEGAFGSLGPVCGNDDIDAIFRMNNMANQLGFDIHEFGQAAAVLMDLTEQGIVSAKDLDGISMTWGNCESMIKMMEKVAFREGIGDILANGIVRAIDHFGPEAKQAVSHAKGMVLGALEPRMMKGSALALATSTRGADHLRSLCLIEFYPSMSPEAAEKLFGTAEVMEMGSYNKANATIYYQHLALLPDLVEVCRFLYGMGQGTSAFSTGDLVALYSLATGIDTDEAQMFTVAERVYNIERAFSCREGISRKDDHLVGKWSTGPVPSGPHKGEVLEPDKWETMLDDYYRVRGWDENGIPARDKLRDLGIEDVADSLQAAGAYDQS